MVRVVCLDLHDDLTGSAAAPPAMTSRAFMIGRSVDFAAITAAIVGGTLLTGGRGGILHSAVGVLLVTVLTNGLVQIGVSPYWQGGVQGLIVVVAVAAVLGALRGAEALVVGAVGEPEVCYYHGLTDRNL